MEVKLPTEGTRYVQALLLTATAYLQYRAHFLPAVAAYRGYGPPAVPKVPVILESVVLSENPLDACGLGQVASRGTRACTASTAT